MIQIAADLCHSCKHYDICNNECESGNYIDNLSSCEIVIECDDYAEGVS